MTDDYKKGFFKGYAEGVADLDCEFRLLYEYAEDKDELMYKAMRRDFKRFQTKKEIETAWSMQRRVTKNRVDLW